MEKCLDEKDRKIKLTEDEISECKRYYKSFEYEQNNYVTKEDIKKATKEYVDTNIKILDEVSKIIK